MGGKSLNERVLQGPDLNNKLLHVLMRFREYPFAIQADIEAMYNQIRIPVDDRDSLRFLWYTDGILKHFRMTTHLFGGIWCGSSSSYALRRSVLDSKSPSCISKVKVIVNNNFYVDDCLCSTQSKGDADIVIIDVRKILGEGGFNLTKFVSNDAELLERVPIEHRANEVRDFSPQSVANVLGIKWNVMSDEFYFEVNCNNPILK
ncbi:Uncharacterised protein at_DN2292 [Pycnogonum litorale]